MHWKNDFSRTDTGPKVNIEITFSSEADLEKIIEMGFKESFTAAHTHRDELLEQKLTRLLFHKCYQAIAYFLAGESRPFLCSQQWPGY